MLKRDYMLAIQAAVVAGKKIMEIYSNIVDVTIKPDGSPVTIADIASSEIITYYLNQSGIPIINEETLKEDYSVRKLWPYSWSVDPLDGTKEFIKQNNQFAINIALIHQQSPMFGLIASPTEEFLLFGGRETGVYKSSFDHWDNHEKWQKINVLNQTNNPLIISCSNSNHSEEVLNFINDLKEKYPSIDFLRKGSALKFIDLALEKADVYPRFAPTMEWDIAAGQAIIEALGGSVVHTQTKLPLRYNKENLVNPYFIAHTAAFMNR